MAPDAGVFTSALHACYDRCFDLNDCNVHAVNHIVKEMDKWGVKLTPSHYAQALAILAETVIVNCSPPQHKFNNTSACLLWQIIHSSLKLVFGISVGFDMCLF